MRTKLAQVHSRLVGIHQRYVQLANLDDAEIHNAELYLQAINNQQLICLNFIAFAIANRPSHRQTWEVSNHENATRNRTEPIQQNRPEETRCRSSNSITRRTKFAHGINATLRDTSMPESLKLLALQDSLKDEIQKRVAHIFTSSHSFQSAWAVLENKYGSPGLIIQAHNQYLQQLPTFKNNDFNGVFNMAVAVWDTVSSVNPEHIVMFFVSGDIIM